MNKFSTVNIRASLSGGLLLLCLISQAQIVERDFVSRNYLFNHDLIHLLNDQFATAGIQYSRFGETYVSMDSTSHTILEILNKDLSTDTIYREYEQGVYKCRFNSIAEVGDTLYVLTELAFANDSIQRTKSFGLAKVDSFGNYYPPSPIMSADSSSFYDLYKSHLSFRDGMFEFFGWRHDSVNHYYPVLFQFSAGGKLLHYQAWLSDEPRITKLDYLSDYEYIGNGRYLLADEGSRDTDTYFIADTSETLLETSFFRNDIEKGRDIVKHDGTYYLFSATSRLVSSDFKDHYAIWRMDSATEQMLPPIFYRGFDTLKYNIFVNGIIKESALVFDNQLLFGSNMFFSERPGQGNPHLRWGMHMIDTTGNLLWEWVEADSTLSYSSGVDKIIALDDNRGAVLLGKTDHITLNGRPWIRTFNFDGSTFSLEEQAAAAKPVQVFPNPAAANAEINVVLPFLPDGPVTIKIYNTSGNLVFKQKHNERSNLIFLSPGLNPGVHLLEVEHRGYFSTSRLVAQ